MIHVKVFGQLAVVAVAQEYTEGLPVGRRHVDAIGVRIFHTGREHHLVVGNSGAQNSFVSFDLAIGEDKGYVGTDGISVIRRGLADGGWSF